MLEEILSPGTWGRRWANLESTSGRPPADPRPTPDGGDGQRIWAPLLEERNPLLIASGNYCPLTTGFRPGEPELGGETADGMKNLKNLKNLKIWKIDNFRKKIEFEQINKFKWILRAPSYASPS